MIEPIRDLLRATGKPYIIENVVGAPLENPVLLRGAEFELGVDRPRLFESNILLTEPPPKCHKYTSIAVYGDLNGRATIPRRGKNSKGTAGRVAKDLVEASIAMGIDWMNEYEITQAVPPAYSEYLLRQIFASKTI